MLRQVRLFYGLPQPELFEQLRLAHDAMPVLHQDRQRLKPSEAVSRHPRRLRVRVSEFSVKRSKLKIMVITNWLKVV
jgi:hypothetical protein